MTCYFLPSVKRLGAILIAWCIAIWAGISSAAEDAVALNATFQKLQTRLQAKSYQTHLLAGYLRESSGIIERLLKAIAEDAKVQDDFEVTREINECRLLLGSLAEELNLIDFNRALEKEREKKTVSVRNCGAKGDGTSDDAPAMRSAIEKARALGDGARVFVPRGRYLFDATVEGRHLPLIGLTNLVIEAEPGALFVMKHQGPGLYVENCRNVQVKNLAFDCDPLPFTQGTITAVNRNDVTFDFKVQEGYPDPSGPIFTRAGTLRGLVREPGTGLIDLTCGDPRIKRVEPIGENLYRLRPANNEGASPPDLVRNFHAGQAFVLNSRGTPGGGAMITAVRSEYVTFENCTVYASYDHACFGKRCTALKFIGCTLDRLPGSTRFGVNNADGIHLQSQKVGPYITNTRIRWVNDDCYNSYCLWDVLVRAEGPDLYTVATSDTDTYHPGDNVVIINPNTGRLAGYAIVKDIQTARWRNLSCQQIRLDRPLTGIATTESLGKKTIKARRPMRNEGETEFFICNLCMKGDGFVVQDCDFGFNRSSGMKIKAPNGIVQRVKSERHQLTPMIVKVDLGWREGYYPHNVVVRDNTFTSTRSTVSVGLMLPGFRSVPAKGMYRHLIIENNTALDRRQP